MDDPAVLDTVARRLARIGERRNLDVPALLHRLGIRPDRTGVTRRQVSELTRELWLQTDDELFALGPRAPQRLGFSEASAFRRAFRRWTGRSPGDFR